MPIALMLLGAVIIYSLQSFLYRRYWNRGLSVSVALSVMPCEKLVRKQAGLDASGCAGILHDAYEKARYSGQDCTRSDYEQLRPGL